MKIKDEVVEVDYSGNEDQDGDDIRDETKN